MNIHSFLQVAPHLPPDIAVLVRGETELVSPSHSSIGFYNYLS